MAESVTLPTTEQEQRARWDLLLTDVEHRQEQLRQLRVYEPKRLFIQAAAAAGALIAGGGLAGGLLVKLMIG